MNSIFPWQEMQWQRLINQYRQNRLPHAILITGKKGIGKFKFAENFSKLLLCENSSEKICEKCQSCQWIEAGTHPDKFIVGPEEESKIIKIDQIRQLSIALSKKAQRENGYQVAIIHPADKMNVAAMNALLKTLEEPIGQVCLLLVTSIPQQLPATVRSRCQQINIDLTKQLAIEWLQSQLDRKDDIHSLLAMCNGAPLDALKLATTESLVNQKLWLKQWLQLLRNELTPVSLANEWLQFNITELLVWQLSVVMDLIRLQLGVEKQFLTYHYQSDLLQSIVLDVTLPALFQLLDKILSAYQAINSSFNLNHQLLLEQLLITTYFSCVK